MTYFKDRASAEEGAVSNVHPICLCCGDPTDGPLVGYDLFMPETDHYTRVLLHRDCAFAMAQRLIIDTWPNRHVGELLRASR